MNKTRQYLQLCLDADKWALGMTRKRPRLLKDKVWKYERALRFAEYYRATKGKHSLLGLCWTWRFVRLGEKLGFDISVNTFGPGLRINHYGLLTVNAKAKIGKWCDIHQGVSIGSNNHLVNGEWTKEVPVVGDFCLIGPGAKLFGDIRIGNNVRIGANAVVNKSVEDNMVTCGVPAVPHVNVRKQLCMCYPSIEEDYLEAYPQYRGML